MIISVGDHINLTMKEVELTLNSYTYPVFVNAQNERPDLIASSVIVQIKNKIYIITASHVIDAVTKINSQFYIATDGYFLAIEGEFTRSIEKDRDDFDIAFIELDADFVSKNKLNVLDENKLMTNKSFDSVHLHLIHGYPCSKNKQAKSLKGTTNFKSYAFTYGGKVDKSFNKWQDFNKNKDFHTCMNYGIAKSINGDINTPPSPRGISGGGLWLVPNSFKPNEIYLDAIFIEYYKKDKISFSTKIEKVVEFIENNT